MKNLYIPSLSCYKKDNNSSPNIVSVAFATIVPAKFCAVHE